MKHLKTLTIGAAILAGSAYSASAQELHFIMCGGGVLPADQRTVGAFVADNPGVTVNIETVPWGTCQDNL